MNGDVFTAWDPVEFNTMVDGFGAFEFGLTDGVGEGNPDIIHPTQSIIFTMDITGSCAGTLTCTGADFIAMNGSGFFGAAKFVNGPDDPESPGNEDSAFGTVVPEPGSGMLVGLGLAGLAWWRRTGTR